MPLVFSIKPDFFLVVGFDLKSKSVKFQVDWTIFRGGTQPLYYPHILNAKFNISVMEQFYITQIKGENSTSYERICMSFITPVHYYWMCYVTQFQLLCIIFFKDTGIYIIMVFENVHNQL
jgi:hypothetical protein